MFLFQVIYKHFPEHLAVMSLAILLPGNRYMYFQGICFNKTVVRHFYSLLCYIKNIHCISNVFYSKLKGSRSQPVTAGG